MTEVSKEKNQYQSKYMNENEASVARSYATQRNENPIQVHKLYRFPVRNIDYC